MNRKINLAQLTELFAKSSGLPKNVSALFVRNFFETIAKKVIDEDQVKVKGLGTFKRTDISDRESINVNTGERFVIPSHVKISFNPDSDLKEFINKPFACFETILLESANTEPESENKNEDLLSIDSVAVVQEPEPVADMINEPESEAESETKLSVDSVAIVQEETEPVAETTDETGSETETKGQLLSDNVSEEAVTEKLLQPEPDFFSDCKSELEIKTENETEVGQKIEPTAESDLLETIVEDDETAEESIHDDEVNSQRHIKRSKGRGLRALMYLLGLVLLLLLATYCIWPLNLLNIVRDEMKRLEVDEDLNGAVSVEQVDIVRKDDNKTSSIPMKSAEKNDVSDASQTKSTTEEKNSKNSEDIKSDIDKKTSIQEASNSSQKAETRPTEPKSTISISEEKPVTAEPSVNVPETNNNVDIEQIVSPGFKLTPVDEAKNLVDITFADTTSYKITGTKAVHMLSSGETLTRISQQYYGTKKLWPYIAAYNHLSNTNNIKAGFLLDIPTLENK